jgi:hypothetical protein
MQVPQDITLGLLWPKFTYKYCTEKEIIKNIRARCLSIKKEMSWTKVKLPKGLWQDWTSVRSDLSAAAACSLQ